MSWDDVDPSPEERAEMQAVANKQAASIDEEEREVYRAVFGTELGRKALVLLHQRFIDNPCWEPDHPSPVAYGFYMEGKASIVRMLEAKSRPE